MTVGDSCDGIFDNGGSIKITVTTVTYRHREEDESCEKEIKKELEKKLDKMVMRDLFGKSKTAPTKEERERARKEYLDRRGTDKSRGKNSDLACRMGRKYRR